MSQKVDPFVYRVPSSLKKDRETEDFFNYLIRWCHDIWQRTGGGDDAISNTDTAELYPWQLSKGENIQPPPWSGQAKEQNQQISFESNQESESIPYLFRSSADPVVTYLAVSSNHTCYGPEIVEATSNITVTLDQEPNIGEVTRVKRNTTAGNVIVDGGSFNIDGAATYTMVINYEGLNFLFNGSEYLII